MQTDAKRKFSIAALVTVAFLGGIFFVASAANLLDLQSLLPSSTAQQESAKEGIATAEQLGQAFSDVAERVNPAVVQIQSTRVLTREDMNQFRGSPFEGTPFENFFDQVPEGWEPRPQSGLGSGVFVDSEGYIVTNNHVVQDATELRVVLYDGTEMNAELVGNDPFSDLAVLRVEGNDFPSVPFGSSEELRVGQWVLAFGSPLDENLSNTVTSGIISSLGRYQGGPNSISNYIQSDAAVNPGNSGGPLVNLRGEIVGINSAIASRTGTYNGISFAIPSNIVKNTVDQLIEDGSVERGFLGISFTQVSSSLADALEVPPGAAQISEIAEDANGNRPAGDAGLRPGDVIVAVDGTQLRESSQIISIISNKRPGDSVQITYNRDGEEREATITLGSRPGSEEIASTRTGENRQPNNGNTTNEPTTTELLGMTVSDLTPSLRQSARISDDVAGVLVTDVNRQSDAFREAEIRRGFVITEIDRKPVRSVNELESVLSNIESGETFLLRLQAGENGASFLTALTKEG